jgi:hypothetical protein
MPFSDTLVITINLSLTNHNYKSYKPLRNPQTVRQLIFLTVKINYSSKLCLHHNITNLNETIILAGKQNFLPVPVAALSKAWVCGRSLAGIADSNPSGARMSVSCECCVLSGRGSSVGLITRPEESYRAWRV